MPRHSLLTAAFLLLGAGGLLVGDKPIADARGKKTVPLVAGMVFTGNQKFKGRLKGVGKIKPPVSGATLGIDEDFIFHYTDLAVDRAYAGNVVQNGKKLTATLSPAGEATLELQRDSAGRSG